jgi:predicted transcriptional regulator
LSNRCYAYILISDNKWWRRLYKRGRNSNEPQVFIRRNRVGPLKTQKLLFYVKQPIMQIRGAAEFIERLVGDYKELWDTHGDETCLKNFDEYVDFLKGRKDATFIRFKDLHELKNPISMAMMRKVLGVGKMPRGGKYLNREMANQLIV